MRISKLAIAALCLGMVALLTGDILAQGGRGGRGMGTNSVMNYLTQESVQKELNLDEEQIEQVTEVIEQARADVRDKMQELRDSGDFSAMREAMAEIQAEMAKLEAEKMQEILNEEQLARYQELSLQLKGMAALTEDHVVEALELTEDDVQAIRDAQAASQDKMMEAMQEMRESGDFAGFRELREESQQELEKEIMGLLSDEQKAKFEEMKGKPFEFPQLDRGRGRQREDF